MLGILRRMYFLFKFGNLPNFVYYCLLDVSKRMIVRATHPINHVTSFSADLVWNKSWLRGVLHEEFMRLV